MTARTYLQLYELAQSSEFRHRVEVAVYTLAYNTLMDGGSTAEQLVWSRQALQGTGVLSTIAAFAVWGVVTHNAIAGDEDEPTDVEIQTAIDSLLSVFVAAMTV